MELVPNTDSFTIQPKLMIGAKLKIVKLSEKVFEINVAIRIHGKIKVKVTR